MSDKNSLTASEAEETAADTAINRVRAITEHDNRKYTRRTMKDRRAKARFGPGQKDRRTGAGRRAGDTWLELK